VSQYLEPAQLEHTMKITLTSDLPVHAKHGMRKGRTYDVLDTARKGTKAGQRRGTGGGWVMGDAGERVLVRHYEATANTDGNQAG